jgi:hypothetical protein
VVPVPLGSEENKGVSMSTESITLPSPRLEFRWLNESGDQVHWLCNYSLVLPLREHDCRRGENDEHKEKVLQVGYTNVRMGCPRLPVIEGKVDTPFRDSAHAKWDNEALGGHLPVVAICGDLVTVIE